MQDQHAGDITIFLKNPALVKNIDQVLDDIVEQCKPYLESIGKDVEQFILVSGRKDKGLVSIREIRKDRKSLAGLPLIMQASDNYFDQKFGVRFRSSSVLTAGRFTKIPIESFGDVHLIFPIGEFEFLWSPKVLDYFNLDFKPERLLRKKDVKVDDLFKNKTLKKDDPRIIEWEKEWAERLEEFQYTDKGMKEAIVSGNEIMIHGNKYFAVNVPKLRDLVDQIGTELRQSQKPDDQTVKIGNENFSGFYRGGMFFLKELKRRL